MNKKLLLPMALLAASVVFLFLAWSNPVKSVPSSIVGNPMLRADYDTKEYTDAYPLWLYISYAEIAEGFLAAGLISILAAFGRPKLLSPLRTSRVNRRMRILGVSLAAGGGLSWVAIALASWLFPNPRYATDYVLGSPTFVARETGELIVYSGPGSILQLATLMLGFCGFVLLRYHAGGMRAAREAVLKYVAPLSVYYEAGLLYFLPLSMDDHVMSSLKLYEGGIQPISNWFVLVVACFLAVLGVWESFGEFRRSKGARADPLHQ
ncbi:MAG TPA: hypothetical protein VEJ36_02820 [Nitrososphaerales archaeon]|nr:hypothetical protein [Nitrososphaerales archaeon]